MTAAELAEQTGARLVMPTRTLLQGKPYFSETNVRRTHAEFVDRARKCVEGWAGPVQEDADPAEERSGPRPIGTVVRRVA